MVTDPPDGANGVWVWLNRADCSGFAHFGLRSLAFDSDLGAGESIHVPAHAHAREGLPAASAERAVGSAYCPYMVWQLGVVLIAFGLIVKLLARLFISRDSGLADSAVLATSALIQLGVAILFGASAVKVFRDGTDALHLVLGGIFALVAVMALAMSGFFAWGALRLPSLQREE